MKRRYEYKFVRLGDSAWSFLGCKGKALKQYQEVIEQHSRDGWRLVQVFAPSMAANGVAKFIEVIFERESER